MIYLLGPLLLIASALFHIAESQEEETERQMMVDRVAIIEQAKNSDTPEVLAAAEKAEREIKAIRDKEEQERKEQEYLATLKPYERPHTWVMLFVVLFGIVLMPYLFYKSKRGDFS